MNKELNSRLERAETIIKRIAMISTLELYKPNYREIVTINQIVNDYLRSIKDE